MIRLFVALWTWLTATIARPFGMLSAGLVIGFKQGIEDVQKDRMKAKYEAHMLKKKLEEKQRREK